MIDVIIILGVLLIACGGVYLVNKYKYKKLDENLEINKSFNDLWKKRLK